MAFDKKLFLDFEGLAQYDELIKAYIKNESNESAKDLAELAEIVEANKDAIEVLNGEGEGSIAKAVDDAVKALVDNAPEALDTLKELADWVANDTTASAKLIDRVISNEEAIEALQKEDEDLKEYIDKQDLSVYDSIQSIAKLSIVSLFPNEQGEDESASEAIAALGEGEALKLDADQTIDENIVITKACYIDANGSTFAGTVTVPADVDVVIANAVFANPVVVA